MPENTGVKETEEMLKQYESTELESDKEESEEKEEPKEPSAIFKFLSYLFYLFLLGALGISMVLLLFSLKDPTIRNYTFVPFRSLSDRSLHPACS